MEIISIIVLAIGLSMDSLVVALTSGAIIRRHGFVIIMKIAGLLGVTQAALTFIGWVVGATFADYINQYDHWISFGILVFLGIKMITEALKDNQYTPFNPRSYRVMLSLALATSIDATAVGFSLSLVNSPIIEPTIIIGVVTFIMSAMGIVFGCKIGKRFNIRFIHIFGGLILIIIGSLILAQHTIWNDNEIVMQVMGSMHETDISAK